MTDVKHAFTSVRQGEALRTMSSFPSDHEGRRRDRGRKIRFWQGVAGILLGGLLGVAQADTPAGREYDLKAASLRALLRFIEWPATAFKKSPPTLTICVLGVDPFGPILDKTIAGKTVNGTALAVIRLDQIKNAAACNILFISSSERSRLRLILDALRGSRVLTVGDTDRFIEMGGMINLYVQEGKVRFEINEHALDRPGWRISSKLLSLGKIVSEKTEH
jgi:hypothetical protein